MPYATRQRTINFPKRKAIPKIETKKVSESINATPESKTLTSSAGSSVRKAFHNSVSGGITGRKKELEQLTDFILSHLNSESSGSIYISGLPGTGKTACVNYIIDKNEINKKCLVVKLNCTAFDSSKSVFKRICEELKLKTVKKTEKEVIESIESYLKKKHKMIVLILDEIDQLESKSQSVLYKIFEWPSWKNSKVILIGIANAMDLTDRNLPRLCAKVDLKPVLVHFPPYTKDEIAEILKNCLTEAGVDKMFAPGAVELMSAKVAGTSGDVRRALDLGKRVIEIAEQKHRDLQGSQLKLKPKTETIESSPQKSLKRKIEEQVYEKTPTKLESIINDISFARSPRKCNFDLNGSSPQKQTKYNKSPSRICLGEITPQKNNISADYNSEHKNFRRSPRKLNGLCNNDDEEDDVENCKKKGDIKNSSCKKSPKKLDEVVLRKSPRKLQFDVNPKDVMSVVKTVFGSSKNFKPSEESSFPLHQKLVICTVLLIMKKGKKKDLNIGKLHQVYSKICGKRGLTAVDKSGFLFLCRQVEVTGVIQIGKGTGTLAKINLQWDESEITDALKDLNLLSSILNDASCVI